ncbi:MAG: hypothetical protein GJU76_09055 [Gallionella sp.]|jgi:hypothetical protein|nr:hypothetical protein [Gallionella sp.]
MRFPRHTPTLHPQRGASLMVMLVILVIGVAALLVGSLNSSALNNSRQQQTAAALAQAKDALIGRAAADISVPGSLPCPDNNDDGSADSLGVSDCTRYIGRLPWRTLGLTELRDGSGEHLWYALSRNFRDYPSNHINSDTQGTLNVTGTQTANNLVAIVFSAGDPLSGQSRSPSNMAVCATTSTTVAESLCASNYLEGSNANPSPAATPNVNYQTAATSTFNDQLIFITQDQLFPPVEMRIGREAKHCLDDYAAAPINGQHYPWAADASDITLYNSTSNILFGHLPSVNLTSNDTSVNNMLNALSALQVAANNCAATSNSSNANALFNAGNTLESAAQYVISKQPTSPPFSSSITTPANQAGDKAQDSGRCSTINSNPTSNSVQTYLNQTFTALSTSFPFPWTASCTLPTSTYWADWKNQVFYQIDTAYTPGGGLGVPTLTINGSGTYRAVVLVARKPINGEVRIPSDPTTFLEGGNAHTNPTPNTVFTTYSTSNPGYQTVNDLVLCLDGQVNCK